jgi:voltage-gated potassium channel
MASDSIPTPEQERPAELQAPGYEIFIALLAVISLINLAIFVLPFEPYQKQIAQLIDVPITFIFLADFANRLRQSHPRRVYFIDQRGWLDLLGSLPAFFKLFRIFRLVRVYRLMSAYGLKNIIRGFLKDRADNALLVVVFMVLIVLEFGSMAVVYFEAAAPNANITTGGDAVWWAFVSITTVGYGDKYPVTEGGRISAFFVLAAGVGLFGVLSGYLANFFLAPSKQDEPAPASEPVTAAAATTGADDATLLRMVDELEANIAALRARITDRTGGPETPGASA